MLLHDRLSLESIPYNDCQLVIISKYLYTCTIKRPVHPEEDFEEETMEDDEAELTMNKVEEEMVVRNFPSITVYCILYRNKSRIFI